MAIFLILIGFLANLVGGVMILVAAFKKSVGWGLACLFIPFAGLYFVFNNWDETKNGFLASVGGGVLLFLGAILAPAKVPTPEPQTASSSQLQASAASSPSTYEPPRAAYSPPPAYTPPPVPPSTATVAEEKKHTLEMVYIDRDTRMYYTEKCRKKPDNVARVAKSVALMQGYTPARCGS